VTEQVPSPDSETQAGPTVEERRDLALARKAELECDQLERQLAPAHQRREDLRVWAGASGLVLAAIAMVGGLLSIFNWFHQANKERELRAEERLDRALQALADTRPTQRLSAVVSLEFFLQSSEVERKPRALLSLTSTLALEDAAPVRNAILTALQDLESSRDLDALDRATQSLVQLNRGLAQEGDVWRTRPASVYTLNDEWPSWGKLQATADAIALLLSKGARIRDFSATYLAKVAFVGLDLSGAKFDDAILAWSDFTGAMLVAASFNGADLELTSFRSADLRKALLTLTETRPYSRLSWNYAERQLTRTEHDPLVRGPDFSCADLRGADFTGHPLLALVPDRISGPIGILPQFSGANLKDANFSAIGVYGLDDSSPLQVPLEIKPTATISLPHSRVFQYATTIKLDSPLLPVAKEFGQSLDALCTALNGSNWREANLSSALRIWLETKPPSEDWRTGVMRSREMFRDDRSPCRPIAPWQLDAGITSR
jgi:uncharacterized protein YjbI with pentapeptide repeats